MEISGIIPADSRAAFIASLYAQAGMPPERIPQITDDASFFQAFRDFASAVRVQPHSESEAPRLLKIHGLLLSLIEMELQNIAEKSGTNWGADASELARAYDNRLLFHAVAKIAPGKMKHLVLEKRPARKEPVRRIAISCGVLRKGGSQRCASLLMKQFVRQGKKILLLTNEPRNPLDYPCPHEVTRLVLSTDKEQRIVQMELALKEFQADTCICMDHTLDLMFYDLLTARELGIRTIAMEHSTFSYLLYGGDPEFFFPRNVIYRVCDAVTCLSGMDRQLWSDWGVHACYMPNPLTFDPHSCSSDTLNAKTLILIARLSPNKGTETALEVLTLVHRKHPDAKLILLGEFVSDSYCAHLKQRIQEAGLEDTVLLPGYTTDVSHYLKKSSILLIPSVVEGFPMTLMEAKAYGIPAVCFEMKYLEAARPGMGCIQVGKEDVLGMAQAISELFDDFSRLNQLGRQARASLESFSNEVVEQRWNALFSYLETGDDPEKLFQTASDPALQGQYELLAGKEFFFGLDTCLNNMDFTGRQRQHHLKQYLAENPIMHNALKLKLLIAELFPEGSLRRKILFPPFRWLGRVCGWVLRHLRSIYRRFRPWQETKDKEL